MKTIYFVRHGESQANVDGVHAGSGLDSPLTETGRQQAHLLEQQLKDKRIDLIVTSPLIRASETAAIIAADYHYSGEILPNPLLSERYFGAATGMSYAASTPLIDSGNVEGLESVQDLAGRARQALEWLRNLPADTIVVVSHGSFGQMLGTIVDGGKPEDFLQFEDLQNTGIFRFTLD
jgi:probable phosphoglycerate mutase